MFGLEEFSGLFQGDLHGDGLSPGAGSRRKSVGTPEERNTVISKDVFYGLPFRDIGTDIHHSRQQAWVLVSFFLPHRIRIFLVELGLFSFSLVFFRLPLLFRVKAHGA